MSTFGWHLATALTVVAAFAGCASAPPKPAPTLVTGTIEATASVNPSASKRPSPVLLRVYELKSATAFNNADFMSLYRRDQEELAADLVAKEEFLMSPGESRPYNKTLAPETKYIGVLAAFRDLEHARWRSVVAVKPNQTQQLAIRADALTLEASSR